MKRNMTKWLEQAVREGRKKPMPILAFPCVEALQCKVSDLVADSDLQSRGMAWIASHTDMGIAPGFMDLSVEAQAFGAKIWISDSEVPTVVGKLISDREGVESLRIPEVGEGRTGIYVEAIRKAKSLITDRPVFSGMIGPFSLAARLTDVSEIMMDCYDDPEMVHLLLEKTTEFLISYARAFRDAGADGILIAEPVAGLISPSMEEEFSGPYVRRIVDALQNDTFLVFYHNCGSGTPRMIESLRSIGAAAYHFGNSVDIVSVLEQMSDRVVLGNISPVMLLSQSTDEIRLATAELLSRTAKYGNFILSSGCDIPPKTPWKNIEAFFETARNYENE